MDPEKKLNFIFPTKYVIPKSLKFSLWPSKPFLASQPYHRYLFFHGAPNPSGIKGVSRWLQFLEVSLAQLSNEKNPGYLLYIGDYTTQLYGDYNKPL